MRPRHMWPFNLWFGPLDISDPDVFLIIRRGILQFVIVKPLMSLLILILKISGNYHEGYISKDSAYLWLSLLYNISVCIGKRDKE